MASNRNRRNARNTPRGTNAVGIQKKINQDYAALGRDYKKLFTELLRMPATKYVLGGVAITAVTPFILRYFGVSNNLQVGTFVRENFENIRGRIDDFIHSGVQEEI